MNRRKEYFKNKSNYINNICISSNILQVFPQERDWTCSVACIRTILSGIDKKVLSEKEFINKYKLIPGPYFSKDIKKLKLLSKYEVIYGCDEKDVKFNNILKYMKNSYSIMFESMYNFSHWMVLLGCYILDRNMEKGKMVTYDPYYDEIRLLNVDEFLSMWQDGNYQKNKVLKDFIAIKMLRKML